MSGRPGRVVAELGRPETGQEAADRKAKASADHRKHQTVNNLVLSLLATLAVVVVLVLLVPRGDAGSLQPVDYRSVAADAAGAEPVPLAVPELPAGWSANAAQLRTGTTGGVDVWYIGLLTPGREFIAVFQGFDANSTWVAEQVHKTPPKGAAVIDGARWTVYDNRSSGRDVGDAEYALVAEGDGSTLALVGTADIDEFRVLARALTRYLPPSGDAT